MVGNKEIELLNLPRILNHAFMTFSISKEFPNFETPFVIYKLGKSIQSKKFNFDRFASSLGLDASVNSILPCHCVDSCFGNKDHGHILTGDLRITDNNKLKKLFTKVTKYRESMLINFKETRSEIACGLKSSIESWGTKHNIHNSVNENGMS